MAKDYFDRKRADQTGLPDLAAIQEFELLCPLDRNHSEAARSSAISGFE